MMSTPTLATGACELCTPEDGDCLNAGCNRAAPDSTADWAERIAVFAVDFNGLSSLASHESTMPLVSFCNNAAEWARRELHEQLEENERLQQRVRELEVIRSTVRPRIERLLAQCGFATPMILRILDPVFGDGPADYGADFAARKHPDCVAVMCGKVDCRSSGPCYTLVHPRAEEKGTDA